MTIPTGYNTQGDLVTQTADGRPLNDLWNEFNTVLDALNSSRTSVAALLSYPTQLAFDAVLQAVTGEEFELASEFGEPQGARLPGNYLTLGYTFRDYDRATRFTWKFLRDALAEHIEAIHAKQLADDNSTVNNTILRRLFTPTETVNERGNPVYGLYNGDAIVPPPFLYTTHTAPHNHYIASGNTVIDSGDIETLYDTVDHHGYLENPGARALLFVNSAQSKEISKFRAGVVNNNTQTASHDFIPSTAAPPYLLETNQIVGEVAPANFNNLPVEGSYGPMWVIKTNYIPPNYLALVATAGPNSPNNPIGFREHANAQYRGLRLLPGNQQAYPLISSFYSRAFGVGTRHRGAAACMKITATTYDVPTFA